MRLPTLTRWLFAWLAVWAFWLGTTHSFHPTRTLALIVTTSLVGAYAAAACINHTVLIPRFWRSGRRCQYACWLVALMVGSTAVALAIIRVSYAALWGPDADPNGAIKHFAIDLFGMTLHLVATAAIIMAFQRFRAGTAVGHS